MAIPSFITAAGRLTTVLEEQSLLTSFEFTSDSTASLEIISGSLPPGTALNQVSNTLYEVTGVVSAIASETEYYFDVRVTNADGQTEQGFSILVTQETPVWLTPTRLFSVAELESITHQFQLSDPGGTAEFTKIAGSLPEGVTIDAQGLLNGNVGTVDSTTLYSFTMRAVSSEGTVIDKLFEIEVQEATGNQSPIWLTSAGSIGEINNSESSPLSVNAFDPDGDTITYALSNGSLPTGLSLDTTTGNIIGVCSTSIQGKWPFTIQVTDGHFLKTRNFSITTNENFDASIKWITPVGSLGSVSIGENSLLELEATSNYPIRFSISSGAMPQGLQLHPTNAAIYDDVQFQTTGTYTFTVLAENDFVQASREFKIKVTEGYGEKATRAYFLAPYTKIDEYRELTSHALVKRADLFRPYDDRYGIQHQPKMLVVENLEQSTQFAMSQRLGSKMLQLDLVIGDLKLAYARDSVGNVLYEVVYRKVYEKVSKPLETFTHPQTQQTVLPTSLSTFRDIFINDFPGLSHTLTYTSSENLPLWMTSEQTLGDASSVLGYTPSIPIFYFLPDRGQEFYAEVIKEEEFDQRLKGQEVTFTTIQFETAVDDDLPQDYSVRFHSFLETQEQQEQVALNAPVWFTDPGVLGSFENNDAVSVSVRADDPNGLPRTYSLVQGVLPTGLTLQTNGVINGTLGTLESKYWSFTISADSSSGYSRTRSFQIYSNP